MNLRSQVWEHSFLFFLCVAFSKNTAWGYSVGFFPLNSGGEEPRVADNLSWVNLLQLQQCAFMHGKDPPKEHAYRYPIMVGLRNSNFTSRESIINI